MLLLMNITSNGISNGLKTHYFHLQIIQDYTIFHDQQHILVDMGI